MLLHCCGRLILSVLGTRTLGITKTFLYKSMGQISSVNTHKISTFFILKYSSNCSPKQFQKLTLQSAKYDIISSSQSLLNITKLLKCLFLHFFTAVANILLLRKWTFDSNLMPDHSFRWFSFQHYYSEYIIT